MPQNKLLQDLLDFIQASPTPFHAVSTMRENFLAQGYAELEESDAWTLQPGGKYLVTRNDSSLIAFNLGKEAPEQAGMRMVGAHTDSPCLHIKPAPELCNKGYFQLGVEVYGGALLNPWFDRDLSIAGRVSYQDSQQKLRNTLLDFKRPVAIIPSLAIHLDREVNDSRSINAQKDLPPVLMQCDKNNTPDFRQLLLKELKQQTPDLDVAAVLDYELCLYDCQPPTLIGMEQDFIAAARLDNLLSCFVGMQSMLDTETLQNTLLVCSDHEEVGSASACGADGPFLASVLNRICGSYEALSRCIDHSWLISVDNAHGIHPNYADKHDNNHGPILNQGPVIKINANQRYATNSETSAMFRYLCEQTGVPVQSFVVRSDMACGSTIGPITASAIGVKTLDIGIPTFAMHSIRELAGARDSGHLHRVLTQFFCDSL
jgi:aspartyl aminopeptidase